MTFIKICHINKERMSCFTNLINSEYTLSEMFLFIITFYNNTVFK